jgi:hypothetical protein
VPGRKTSGIQWVGQDTYLKLNAGAGEGQVAWRMKETQEAQVKQEAQEAQAA